MLVANDVMTVFVLATRERESMLSLKEDWMRLTRGLPAVRTRVVWFVFALAAVASGFALSVGAESRNGVSSAPGLQQAAPAARVFNNGAALIQNTVKADKTG